MIRAALGGDDAALKQLVRRLTATAQMRVASVLRSSWTRHGAFVAQEVQDLTQEVLLGLFANQGRTLRRWDPTQGASLETFIGTVAQRLAISTLRSRRRNPYQLQLEDPSESGAGAAEGGTQESSAEMRESLAHLADELPRRLSPQGLHLFHRLFLCEDTLVEVCSATELSREAVYQWRRRLKLLVQTILADWDEQSPSRQKGIKSRAPSRDAGSAVRSGLELG